MRPRLLLLLISLCALLTLVAPAHAAAQDCTAPTDPQTPQEKFDNASAIFVGTVAAITSTVSSSLDADVNIVAFDLQSSWKQTLRGQITAETEKGACGVPFQVGQKWLVYALNVGDTLFIPFAAGSEPFDQNTPSAQYLKDIRPNAGDAIIENFGPVNLIVYIVAAYLIFFLLGAGFYYISRRRRERRPAR